MILSGLPLVPRVLLILRSLFDMVDPNKFNLSFVLIHKTNNRFYLQLNEITVLLYKKIEENQQINKKMEQNQIQHTMFLTKLILNKEIT